MRENQEASLSWHFQAACAQWREERSHSVTLTQPSECPQPASLTFAAFGFPPRWAYLWMASSPWPGPLGGRSLLHLHSAGGSTLRERRVPACMHSSFLSILLI